MALEKLLIEHCSPTLASLKTANLFTCKYEKEKELLESIAYWNEQMNKKGIKVLILRKKERKALIYVCRISHLDKILKNEETMQFLIQYGYENKNIDNIIKQLKIRCNRNEDFPHEIGVFLGYPLEDVTGFINNTGKNFQYAGIWKVYGDQKEAKKRFCKYKKCTEIYTRLWNNGRSIWKLTVAV